MPLCTSAEYRVAPEIIDAKRLRGSIESMGKRDEVLVRTGGCDLGNRSNRHALVDDRNTVIALKPLCSLDKVLGSTRHMVVHLRAHALQVIIRTAHERYAHGDRADVQIVL